MIHRELEISSYLRWDHTSRNGCNVQRLRPMTRFCWLMGTKITSAKILSTTYVAVHSICWFVDLNTGRTLETVPSAAGKRAKRWAWAYETRNGLRQIDLIEMSFKRRLKHKEWWVLEMCTKIGMTGIPWNSREIRGFWAQTLRCLLSQQQKNLSIYERMLNYLYLCVVKIMDYVVDTDNLDKFKTRKGEFW